MKKNTPLIVLISTIVLLAFIETIRPKPLDFSDSYSKIHSRPLGAMILREQLPALFPNEIILENEASIYLYPLADYDTLNTVFINSEIDFDEFEAEKLWDELLYGSSVFISADFFAGPLADSLKVEISFSKKYFQFQGQRTDSVSKTEVSLDNGFFGNEFTTSIETGFFSRMISSYDSLHTQVLGKTGEGEVFFIRTRVSDGWAYIHTIPFLFTNYALLENDAWDIAFASLSVLPEGRHVIWDEYYKAGRQLHSSALQYIGSETTLKTAWYTALLGVILFFIFRGRREQRPLPIVSPPQNSSILFVEAISQLYLERKSIKNIAEKRIRFFWKYIHEHLSLSLKKGEELTPEAISASTGADPKTVSDILRFSTVLHTHSTINQEEFIQLNSCLDSFYSQVS